MFFGGMAEVDYDNVPNKPNLFGDGGGPGYHRGVVGCHGGNGMVMLIGIFLFVRGWKARAATAPPPPPVPDGHLTTDEKVGLARQR